MAVDKDGASGAAEITGGTAAAAETTLTDEQKKKIAELQAAELVATTEQKSLAAQKNVIDAQKELQTAELALLTARLPASTVTAPTGEVTSEAGGYMAELIAFQAMQRCAAETAERINDKLPGDARLLVVDTLAVAQGDFPRLLVQSQFDQYKKSFQEQQDKIEEQLQQEPPAAESEPEGKFVPEFAPALGAAFTALSVAPQVLGAAASLLSYFKTDYTIKSKTVTLADSALRAAVAGKIDKGQTRVLDFYLAGDSRLIKQYMALLEGRFKLELAKTTYSEQVVNRLAGTIEEIKEQLKKLQDSKKEEERTAADQAKITGLEKEIPRISAQKGDAEQIVARCTALISKFDEFVTLVTAKSGDEQPLLLQAAVRDHILAVGTTHLLYLKVESKGGESITKKSIWTRGGETAFLGGVAASYILVDVTGAVLSADTISAASELHRKVGGGPDSPVKRIEIPLS